MGVEPTSSAWKAEVIAVIPQTRIIIYNSKITFCQVFFDDFLF